MIRVKDVAKMFNSKKLRIFTRWPTSLSLCMCIWSRSLHAQQVKVVLKLRVYFTHAVWRKGTGTKEQLFYWIANIIFNSILTHVQRENKGTEKSITTPDPQPPHSQKVTWWIHWQLTCQQFLWVLNPYQKPASDHSLQYPDPNTIVVMS